MRIVIAEAGNEYRTASERQIRTPQDAADQAGVTADSETETMTVLCLDTKNGMRSAEIISMGILGASLVHPREVFRVAILKNAASIVLVHNHPSGDVTPSADDIRITRQLVEAGRIVDIKVLDHIIIGRQAGELKLTSIREEGLIDFT